MSQREIKPLKEVWICIDPKGIPDMGTVRTEEIQSKMSLAVWAIDWIQWEQMGWKCVKVNISFESLNHKGN